MGSITAAPEDTRGLRPSGDLLLHNATVIDGTGAPPYGPASIRIRGDRIVAITSALDELTDAEALTNQGASPQVTDELDLHGSFVLPGLIDAHAHIGHSAQVASAQYPFKLWLACGITTVREAGALGLGLDFVVSEAARSAKHQITAPRIVPYVVFGQGAPETPHTHKAVIEWVQGVADRGATGIKFFGTRPDPMRWALAEAERVGLLSMCHHAQTDVARVNALTTAGWGMGSVEHGYGLAEAMLTSGRIQEFPPSYNYHDEHDRFAQLGRSWAQAAHPGSKRWCELLDELVGLGSTLVPTFVAHLAARDLEHARGRRYHQEFTSRRLRHFFTPGLGHHGSFFTNWGSVQEVAWRENYRLWMSFVGDFHSRGGRVCAGSDAGFIYNTFGFGLIEEMELLCEAGLSPLESIRAATLSGAELLRLDDEIGSVEIGKKADVVVVAENPLANLKVLSAAGHLRFDGEGNELVVGAPQWTIKDGIVYDARQLADEVRQMVADERLERPLGKSGLP